VAALTLPAADSLVDDIATFVTALEGGSAARAMARRLGATLLGPALNNLGSGIARLVIVPDGPLYRVPFDALELRDGRPALLRYAITLAPSARIAHASWLAPTQARGNRLLAMGDPAYGRTSGLPRLPESRREAQAVASGVPGARVLVGARASEAALTRSDLRDVRVLHLATHAEVEDFGLLRSALALAAGAGEDGRVGVPDIAALDLDADLVVLSGCRTAGGVVVTGEGIQGLVGPFLEAGARAVVATHWAVGDRSIVDLMSRFYSGLRAGLRAGDALRAAKIAAHKAGVSPAVWAAVVLTGDARVRPLARATVSS
jgi:CHAT domain-containing protein